MESYVGLSRAPIQSHFRAAMQSQAKAAPGVRPPTQDFDSADIWPWIVNWLKATFKTDIESLVVPADKKHTFPAYPSTGERGHYDISGFAAADGSIRIALAGDWGTGTDIAQQVTDSMTASDPELTIHLGDIYYVGELNEVEENCLGQNTSNFQGVIWKHGSKGSLALNGNHEMYSGGNAYFNKFLPTLGIPSTQDKQQLASYFCLESANWRIVAIDTGYNADTISGDCTLDQISIDWLKTVVNPVAHRKPTIVLGHHQWFSGFGDGDYPKPANQIAPFFPNQEIVWLWGHEHRLIIYNKYKGPNHLTAWARCIGHGGMPCEMPAASWTASEAANRVEYWDGLPQRVQTLADGTEVSRNGYAMMTIQGPKLTLEYFDADGASVLRESFTPNGGANWNGTFTRTVESDPQILNQLIWQT
jgi:hypothetical protein